MGMNFMRSFRGFMMSVGRDADKGKEEDKMRNRGRVR